MGTRAVVLQSCGWGQVEFLEYESLDAIMVELNPECRAVLSTCRCKGARIGETSASSRMLALRHTSASYCSAGLMLFAFIRTTVEYA
jgi:hypothetical protein